MSNLGFRIRYGLRRWKLLHFPLRWLNRTFRPALGRFIFSILRFGLSPLKRIGPPTGWFSAFELLKREPPGLRGRIVMTDQGAPLIPEPSVMLLCERRQHQEQPWPVLWSHHRDARLIGISLVHLNEQKKMCAEAAYGVKRAAFDPAYQYLSVRLPLRLEGPWTSLVSRWVPTDAPPPYAHWLLDSLPRLALLNEFPSKTQIIVPPHRLKYQVESLEMLGLLDRCRWTKETHLQVEDYYFSAPPSMIVCHSPYTVEFLRATFLKFAKKDAETARRIFIRRTGPTRNMVNESEVLDFFRSEGWRIVDAAQITFAEQIALFSNADVVCGIHGSGLANIVWCKPGCTIIELFADSYLAGDQEWISQCIGAHYHFMIFPSNHNMSAHVDLRRLKTLLSSLQVN